MAQLWVNVSVKKELRNSEALFAPLAHGRSIWEARLSEINERQLGNLSQIPAGVNERLKNARNLGTFSAFTQRGDGGSANSIVFGVRHCNAQQGIGGYWVVNQPQGFDKSIPACWLGDTEQCALYTDGGECWRSC
jgi:hypothetical protein